MKVALGISLTFLSQTLLAASPTVIDDINHQRFKLIAKDTSPYERCSKEIQVQKSFSSDEKGEQLKLGALSMTLENKRNMSYDSGWDVHVSVKNKFTADENSASSTTRTVYRDGIVSQIYGLFSKDYPVRSKFFDIEESYEISKTENGFKVRMIKTNKLNPKNSSFANCEYQNGLSPLD